MKYYVDVCCRSPLLSSEEQTSLLVHLVGNSPSVRPPPSGASEYINWAQLARPRVRCPPHYLPINSSQGAGRCEGSPCKSAKGKCWRWRWWPSRKQKLDKPSSHKQKKKKDETMQQQDKSDKPICCSSTCDYLIILIACLFD
jgi:hypothetical protein